MKRSINSWLDVGRQELADGGISRDSSEQDGDAKGGGAGLCAGHRSSVVATCLRCGHKLGEGINDLCLLRFQVRDGSRQLLRQGLESRKQ